LALLIGAAIRDRGGSALFHPHGYCYLWQPGLVSLHVIADSAIGLAYVAISLTLLYFVYRARRYVPFGWIFVAFALFIVACGATHFMEIWTLWAPLFWLSGAVKVLTAGASVITAIVLPPLIPRALDLLQAQEERRRAQELLQRELASKEDDVG